MTLHRSLLFLIFVLTAPVVIQSTVVAAEQSKAFVKLSKDQVRFLQEVLNLYEFDAGPADGRMGKKTRAAVRRFQEHFSLSPTGDVTQATWDLIKQAP